jgi:hypothetical protein
MSPGQDGDAAGRLLRTGERKVSGSNRRTLSGVRKPRQEEETMRSRGVAGSGDPATAEKIVYILCFIIIYPSTSISRAKKVHYKGACCQDLEPNLRRASQMRLSYM